MNKQSVCITCKQPYPAKRAALGYRVCTSCSEEEKWSAVPVTYHKTGNTIEVIKDPDDAAAIVAMTARVGFGVMRGMKSTSVKRGAQKKDDATREVEAEAPRSFIGKEIARRKMPLDYEGVGLAMMKALEEEGAPAALHIVNTAEREWKLLPKQAVQLKSIIETLVKQGEYK